MTADNALVQGERDDPLKSLLKTVNSDETESRRKFEQRLQTFSPATYFAKPTCLSPLVAARFGWTNTAKDTLVCTECHAALVVTINPNLSTRRVEALCCTYKQRFATSHAIDCSYRSDAEWFLMSSSVPENPPFTKGRFLVPLCFASVLPHDAINLLEDCNPRQTLQCRVKKFLDYLPEPVSTWKLRGLSLSKDIRNFVPTSDVEPHDDASFADRVSNSLRDHNNIYSHNFTSAAILALFGWSVKCVTKSDSLCTFTLKCPICLATPSVVADKMKPSTVEQQILTTPQKKEDGTPSKPRTPRVVIDSSDSSSEEEEKKIRAPPRKRLRIVQDTIIRNQQGIDPLSSHRHYCVMARGFQFDAVESATPGWKILASNLLQPKTNNRIAMTGEESTKVHDNRLTGKDALDAVRETLRAGICKK